MQRNKCKYEFLAKDISAVLSRDARLTRNALGIQENGAIILSGDLEGKELNKGLVNDISRKSLRVKNEILKLDGSEIFSILKKKCKELIEKHDEKFALLFSKNYYVQEIIKWNFALVNKLIGTETTLKTHDSKKDINNLSIEKEKIYITCFQSGFDFGNESKKSIIGSFESRFKLTENGFELVSLKTNDTRFQELLDNYPLQEKLNGLFSSLEKILLELNEEKSPFKSQTKNDFLKEIKDVLAFKKNDNPILKLLENNDTLLDLYNKMVLIQIRFENYNIPPTPLDELLIDLPKRQRFINMK